MINIRHFCAPSTTLTQIHPKGFPAHQTQLGPFRAVKALRNLYQEKVVRREGDNSHSPGSAARDPTTARKVTQTWLLSLQPARKLTQTWLLARGELPRTSCRAAGTEPRRDLLPPSAATEPQPRGVTARGQAQGHCRTRDGAATRTRHPEPRVARRD